MLRPLEQHYPANPNLDDVAGIVVLGGGEVATRSAHWDQPQVNEAGDRYLATISLARRFPGAFVLFAGGNGSLRDKELAEADVAEKLFLAAGVSRDRLILEGTSRNTAENARNALALRDPGTSGTWVLVTSAFHMPRAVEAFCAAGWSDLAPWPTDYRGDAFADGLGWDLAGNLTSLETVLREQVGLLAYRLTGRADQDALSGCLAGMQGATEAAGNVLNAKATDIAG